MANVGPNKGQRLRLAISRFAAMLIEEARDLTGFTYDRLDEELGYSEGTAYRYSLYPPVAKTRTPVTGSIQLLESRVAKLLKRAEHKIVIEDNKKIDPANAMSDLMVGRPTPGVNVRDSDPFDLQLGYEDDWPTYRRLKYSFSALAGGAFPLHLYAWQWGILWERGYPGLTLEAMGLPAHYTLEDAVREMTESAKRLRKQRME